MFCGKRQSRAVSLDVSNICILTDHEAGANASAAAPLKVCDS